LAAQALGLQRLCTLAGGDDYELLFTAPPERSAAVAQAATQAGVAVTRIGRIAALQSVVLRDAHGQAVENVWAGFDHFAA
jgi:thiamine-monophosphate kinase